MHIRPVELRDAAGLVNLLNEIIATGVETSIAEPLTLKQQQAFIGRFPQRGVFLVAELKSEGPIIGMQSIEPHGALGDCNDHIGEISTFVARDHRGAGVGSALMQRLSEAARNKGFLKLMATIRADNSAAQAFYAHAGFRVIGLLKGHARYRGRLIDQVLAELILSTSDN